MGIPWSKTDDVPQLTNKTLDALNLLPSNIQATDQGADAIKAILVQFVGSYIHLKTSFSNYPLFDL